jgi:N-acetylneuraminic acid mutarotase
MPCTRRIRVAFRSSLALLALASVLAPAWGQTSPVDQWTWNGGFGSFPAGTGGPSTFYGTKGVPGAQNTPGGRTDYVSWTDDQGNFWLFGDDGVVNDLWKYDTASGQWTWVSGPYYGQCATDPQDCWPTYGTLGVPDPANTPPPLQFASSFTGSDGNLWLIGGLGLDARQFGGALNALWKYDPLKNEWTQMSGGSQFIDDKPFAAVYGSKGVPAKANTPGSITFPETWSTPDGNLWVYGGTAEDDKGNAGDSDDLWSYNIATGMWTWVSGSGTTADQFPHAPSYGTKGLPAPSNSPGARIGSTTWTDRQGNLWLFSGLGQPNDLWEFDPAANLWTWVSGTTDASCYGAQCASDGIYGTLGIASPGNTPGTRTGAAAWRALDGTLWLYGGLGPDSTGDSAGTPGTTWLNDLWQFDPATGQWTWMSGADLQPCAELNVTQYSSWGTWCWTSVVRGEMGSPDASNTPGSRNGSAAWRDLAGNLRLFGGDNFFGSAGIPYSYKDALMDDVWSFHPASAFDRVTSAPKFSLSAGNYTTAQTVTISDADSGAAIYYTTDGSTPGQQSDLYAGSLQLSQNTVLKAVAVAANAGVSGVTEATYVFQWSFSMSMAGGSPSGVNIPRGSSGTFTLEVNPILGSTFPSTVTFSVSGLPEGATGAFNPSSIASGSAQSKINLTVQTRAASAMLVSHSTSTLFLCFLGSPLLLLASRRRAITGCAGLRILFLGLALAAPLGFLSACGGGGASSGGTGGSGGNPTPAGTYPLTITATCGQAQAKINVTAVVQ